MSIQSEIDRLSAAKASIAASLQAMGMEPPSGTTLEQYAARLAAIAAAAPWLSIPGGGTMQMGESLGDGPYTIEVTEDGEGGGLSAEQVGYSNTGSGLEATNVQEAIDELAGRSVAPRRNLLDNWDFTGRVVNQRGKNIYTVQALEGVNSSYTVDRMIVSASANASATLTVSDGSLVLACSPPGGGGLQVNLFERLDVSKWPRGTYTLSWLYESDIIVRPFVYTDESGVKPGYADFPTTSGKPNIANIEFDLTEADRTAAVNLQINSGAATSTKIYACKVEYGTGQTLAAQVDDKWMLLEHADYAWELAKCQRYQIPLDGSARYPVVQVLGADDLLIFIPLPTTMRLSPTISDPDGKMKMYDQNGALQPGFTFEISSLCSNGIMVHAKKNAHGFSGGFLYIDAFMGAGAPMLDANL